MTLDIRRLVVLHKSTVGHTTKYIQKLPKKTFVRLTKVSPTKFIIYAKILYLCFVKLYRFKVSIKYLNLDLKSLIPYNLSRLVGTCK